MNEQLQEANELQYCHKHVDASIQAFINNNEQIAKRVEKGIAMVNAWLAQPHEYLPKQQRINQLRELDIDRLCRDTIYEVAYALQPELLVSVVAKIAARLGFSERKDALQSIAEMMAILCQTDLFDINKPSKEASLMVQSRIILPPELLNAIDMAMYTPPMVCKPKLVNSNFESPYLTFNETNILGKGNSHSGDICLDIINLQNQIELSLCEELINSVEEVPNKPHENLEAAQQFETFTKQSAQLYQLLISQGNRFYMTNKVDKRGRLYVQGYHISTQGTAYKKAIVELAHKEPVDGLPDHLRR